MIHQFYWTEEMVKLWLEDAAATLQALPAGRNSRPAGLQAWWPDFIQQTPHLLLGDNHPPERRKPPTAGAISRMDQVLDWLLWVPEKRRRQLIWARAMKVPVTKLARIYDVHRETIRLWHTQGIQQIANHLNRRAGHVSRRQ